MSAMSGSIQTPVDMELGIFHREDEDEMYLRKLSVYATIRPGDLKRDAPSKHTNRHSSLTDLLQCWDIRCPPEDEYTVSELEEHLPVQLELREHELPVQGFEIDSRIVPGFRYSVRYIETNEYLYGGEAKLLKSIGLGYGRRMTFQGDRLNFNDCYFWSDSIPSGYAFNIEAFKEGAVFTIVDTELQAIGTVEVQNVQFPQIEMDTVIEGNNVVKNVRVRFACFLKLYHHHGLINVNTQDFEEVEGIAQLVMSRGSKEAIVKCINDVYFQSLGRCTLHSDHSI